jgi:hypothetical protein
MNFVALYAVLFGSCQLQTFVIEGDDVHPAFSDVGCLTYDQTHDAYTMTQDVPGDVLYVDAFELETFANTNTGWSVNYTGAAGRQTADDLECGLWQSPQLVVVNCNVVQPYP